jgi:hypothetical protein
VTALTPAEPLGDAYQTLIAILEPMFQRGDGRQTISIRCGMCGNAEIASVRVIGVDRKPWLVFGSMSEDTDVQSVVDRRLRRGWRPNALRAWMLHSKGLNLDVNATPRVPSRRVRTRALHIEVLNFGDKGARLVEANCRTHGRFYIYKPQLMERPQRRVRVIRVNPENRPSSARVPNHES